MVRKLRQVCLLLVAVCGTRSVFAQVPMHAPQKTRAEAKSVLATLQKRCTKCHGNQKPAGDLNLAALTREQDLLARPKLIADVIDAVESEIMPPEKEPPLAKADRARLLKDLRGILHAGLSKAKPPRTPIRRMNRFQYNNAVRDLFDLNVVVFPLPERMLREHGNYFQPQTGKMPALVRAGSRPLGKSQLIERRLGGVTPFPQDRRAEHGFDTRGDHLSLSPILLESFLKLGRSIVESRDFGPKTCGIWGTFFAPPKDASNIEQTVRGRLSRFLTHAFRRPVDAKTLDRYTTFVSAKLEAGTDFPAAMKSAAAAVIASPRFFYLFEKNETPDAFDLASRLSFFLWGSIPDDKLLELAKTGELAKPKVLRTQVKRMLRDRKLKRFCDSFPAQWLQLERIVSSTPDRNRFPQFYFLKYRASMHMMLEPLLVFETVLIENHSILKFIDSDFSYRSNLLTAWYRNGSQGRAGSPVVVPFRRVQITDRRQGGLITNAAVLTMTSGISRTKPITRGTWISTVILNDPPKPPPADVPTLPEKPKPGEKDLTIRERFAVHRKKPSCAGCHRKIDPLGFALENYNAVGIWRNKYDNGRNVDSTGTLFKRKFKDVVEFKDALLAEKDRFARGLASHLMSFALGREVGIQDSGSLDAIVKQTAKSEYRIQALIEAVVLSDSFRGSK